MVKGLNVSLASSNYLSSDGNLESLNTVRFSVPVVKGGTLSVDSGFDTNFKKNEDNKHDYDIIPAFEMKYKQKVGNNFRGYVRYRNKGLDDNQLRVAAGVSYPLGSNLSLYGDAHYTTKFEEGKDRFGGWVGADCQIGKNVSCWAEVQKNFNPDSMTINGWEKGQWAVNAGLTYKF